MAAVVFIVLIVALGLICGHVVVNKPASVGSSVIAYMLIAWLCIAILGCVVFWWNVQDRVGVRY